jgi:Stress responsive A/B Barrel Domain
VRRASGARAISRGADQTDDVIRNVVVGRLRQGADEEALAEALRGLLLLPLDGLLEMQVGRDAGLREGTWDYVITADFTDADAYRRYDADEEHNRLRRELFDVLSEEIARVQFEIPDVQAQPPATVPGESSWAQDEAPGGEPPPGKHRRGGAHR